MRERLKLANVKFDNAQSAVNRIEKACSHNWSDPVYDPIHRPGYHVPAENCGSDSRPARDVPDSTEDQWTRTCKFCGKVDTTKQTRDEVKTVPTF